VYTLRKTGGNQKAKEIYFKDFDPVINSQTAAMINRPRDFIKHICVNKRYSGDKGGKGSYSGFLVLLFSPPKGRGGISIPPFETLQKKLAVAFLMRRSW